LAHLYSRGSAERYRVSELRDMVVGYGFPTRFIQSLSLLCVVSDVVP